MRDRLVEILDEYGDDISFCDICKRPTEDCEGCKNEQLADYLLANGVIVPPCKVGDKVYVIKYCRCGNAEPYHAGHCFRKVTKSTPKVLAQKMELQKGKKMKFTSCGEIYHTYEDVGTICHRVYEKPFNLDMLTSVGKTVFLTKEEAEQALKGGAE